ncbi:hypothetical protein RR46_14388 [Papilio xuthus]|uniref:BCL-11A-like CCHC zinc finger domain-containing protein n=1 Tax=Papilio xuthus TaxID=66420 RepID=A0A194PDX2_PAPXU|nr:hypothetical protein RR46_14388 [Papilio xuthus]
MSSLIEIIGIEAINQTCAWVSAKGRELTAVHSPRTDADSAAEGGGSPSPGVPADTLTCGACRRAFALADIVRFIQHKVSSCDKDLTYHCYSAGPNSDQEDGSRTGQVATGNSSGRRPSLLTARRPPNSRVHTPPLVSPSIAPPDLIEDGGASSTPKRLLDEADAEASTPKRRASTSPMPSSSPDEDIKPKIKQEHMDTSGSPEDQKKSRTEVADAESNTMHSALGLPHVGLRGVSEGVSGGETGWGAEDGHSEQRRDGHPPHNKSMARYPG